MTPHPRALELTERFRPLFTNAVPWSRVAFRATAERYANRDDLLTGEGSKRAGGRWNPIGSFRTVYLSIGVDTAVSEFLGQFAHYGLQAAELTPFVVAGAEVRLTKTLDLTTAALRRSLHLKLLDLIQNDWRAAQDAGSESLTQVVGRIAFELEFDGLLVPSATKRGETNVVVFPGNLDPPNSYLKPVNREKLPLPRRP